MTFVTWVKDRKDPGLCRLSFPLFSRRVARVACSFPLRFERCLPCDGFCLFAQELGCGSGRGLFHEAVPFGLCGLAR
jgi:hypothetical protein